MYLQTDITRNPGENFSVVAKYLYPSRCYINMNASTEHLNNLMPILESADHGTENKRCDDAMSLLREYEKQWTRTAQICGTSLNVVTKYHHLHRCTAYMRIWRIAIR